MKILIPLLSLLWVTLSASAEAPSESSQGEDFLSKVDPGVQGIVDDSDLLQFFDRARNPLKTRFTPLPSGSTRPRGWILATMKEDLQSGIVGALDALYPPVHTDDLYRTARRGGMSDIPDMGDLVLTGEPWEQSIMWWNAETAGNWWDGFVRYAFLTEDPAAIAKTRAIVDNLLSSQDEDAYIGIYRENLRYQHRGSNGELWAQTTAYRTLLGYYELTGDTRALDAVKRAMALTMRHYNAGARNPFYLETAFGGVTHGLMMTDVCETLHRITGDPAYLDYATYLYRAFSTYSINRAFNDLRYPLLLERDEPFTGHAAHTYEHFRSLLAAYYHTGYPELKTALENALYKLDACLLPGGGGHGNEWIAGLDADPTYTASEFCAMLELRNSFTAIMQKTGDTTYADRAEKLTFNAILGARNADGTAITYGKADNCYILDGHHHAKDETTEDSRYKYSPTHSEPAVCCVPNYGRNFPYYLDSMWMKTDDGLAALMFGPSLLQSDIRGSPTTIEQRTDYPFSNNIEFIVRPEAACHFTLTIRIPEWSNAFHIDAPGASIERKGSFCLIEKTWERDDHIQITFDYDIEAVQFRNGETYYQRGPLVYAYPISSRVQSIKAYNKPGFADYYCYPTEQTWHDLAITRGHQFTFVPHEPTDYDSTTPWHRSVPVLAGNMRNLQTGEPIPVRLVPMGTTVLRRVTFPVFNN